VRTTGTRGIPLTGPELVFALVCPVGTPTPAFLKALEGDLLGYGYSSERIKLSTILADEAGSRGDSLPSSTEDVRIAALMDEGDRLCRQMSRPSAVALLGVAEIRARRQERHVSGGATPDQTGALQDLPVERAAWILDSVKRPGEILQLRALYGDHVIVVGLNATRARRVKALVDRLTPQRKSFGAEALLAAAEALIERDLTESDEYGQNTLRAFPMSDVFIDVDDDDGVAAQVTRLSDLLFGSPDFPVPTDAEYGMHLAQTSSTRSPELGLKVGAAILGAGQTVVSLGANAHPVPTGSPAFDESALEIRALVIDTLRQLGQGVLLQEALDALGADPDGYAADLIRGPLKSAAINALIEFQPTVHAEMDALLSALKSGHEVTGATVYVTAYPCHNCAKHLLALGLQVRYLEPYPKSRAAAMYGAQIGGTFGPFIGVAPRRYHLFETEGDSKTDEGGRKPWEQPDKHGAQPKVDPFVDPRGIADREATAIAALEPPIPVSGVSEPQSGGNVSPTSDDADTSSSARAEAPESIPKPGQPTSDDEGNA
jgi:deoxycytidylate deaminase